MNASASVKTSRIKCLSYASLQGSKADRHLVEKALIWAFRSFKSAKNERVGKLLADRLDEVFMSTFGELDISAAMQVDDSTLSSTSSCALAASVVFAFLLFVIVIFAHRKNHRSSRLRHGCLINFACSSSNSTVFRPIVAPMKCFRFLVVVAFVMAVIVPSTESAATNDFTYRCKDCGGNNWYCSRSSCLYISTSTSNWSEAADLCSSDGASLLSIESVNEDETITAIIENSIGNLKESESFFFGLLRAPSAATGVNRYRWADGSPLTYARWTSLKAFKGEALCGTLLFTRLNGSSSVRWNADSCSSRHKFICKKSRQLRDGEVRLVDDVLPTRGRLEIYIDGSWKGVCLRKDIYSSSQTAAAACRQMNYDGLLEASSRIGEGEVVSHDVYCTENDVSVRSCTTRLATCNEHLFVSCRSGSVQSLAVRLVNSSAQLVNSSSERRMEIGVGNLWKRACIDHDRHDQQSLNRSAENICRHMGYGEGKWQSYGDRPPGIRLPLCRNISCNSEDCFSLQENGVAEYHLYNNLYLIRSSSYILEIKCGIPEWDIRLVNGVGGTKGSKGRVEVYLNTTWSVVCDSEWTWNESNVVCRQFGFERAISTEWRVHENSNDTMIYIYINGTRCKGTETAFKDCDFRQIEWQSNESCHEPVVVCEERKYCPIGWFLYAGYCYALSNQSSRFLFDRWDLVERHCGRSLLSISSPYEHAFVMSLLAEVESKGESIGEDVWIGLERGSNDEYKWINDDPFSYAMWARGEPGLSDLYNCVAMDSRTGYWKTADCRSSKKVVCKIALVDLDNKVRQVAAPTFDNRCFEDEVHFNNACFHLSKRENESVAQDRAILECQMRGGAQLASFRCISEHFFIAKESSGLNGLAYWIGLVYKDTTGSFTWLDGTPAAFSMWAKYEPAYKKKGECVTFGFDGLHFGWSVQNCSANVGYVCKRTLNGTTEIDIAPTESRRGYDFLCPNSWNLIGKSCFRRNDALKTWHESLANCERWSERWRKGSLVSTSSLQEMNRLSGMLGVREAWIGLNDIDSEGMYNWTDGSPYFYARWSSSESTKTLSDRETHDCVAATTTGWNSRDCFQKLSSVCSMPAIFDFDECHNNSHNCSVDASCVNTLDSFECVCNIGFSGNGTTCIDYSVCDNCTATSQVCVLKGGSYSCNCRSGWLKNGSLCDDFDECASCRWLDWRRIHVRRY
ncbi:C-type mannose receptor 2-like isoform X3 [Oscarella lobularis]|uniref:C-type mannose receptor 2-like isoform X3 n=1 Tax=Oscarella lobularis TaxID=121494 RepID=UPI003313EAF6